MPEAPRSRHVGRSTGKHLSASCELLECRGGWHPSSEETGKLIIEEICNWSPGR